jgi:putative ABC transport system permease protein
MTWWLETIRDGLLNLMRHRLRSFLTLLGVVFGTGAVVAMLGISEGAQRTVLQEISSLGLQNIYVDSVEAAPAAATTDSSTQNKRGKLRYGLTWRDVARIREACPKAILETAHFVDERITCGGRRIAAKTFGVEPAFMEHSGARLLEGTPLTPSDVLGQTRSAWVTPEVFDALRRAGFIERETFRIAQHEFRLAGVVRLASADDASTVLIPYSTAKTLYGTTIRKREAGRLEFKEVAIGRLLVRAPSESEVAKTAAVIHRTLEAAHAAPDYRVSVPLELLHSKQRTQRILNAVLVSIASISLLVGGIGIMNIMLAIVTERIPEIGLRRAVGARKRDIMLQFLIETVALATLGGVAGCALGWIGVTTVSFWTGWSGVITPLALFLSVGVSWVVGVLFGLAPAVRAAQMDPVKALRYE